MTYAKENLVKVKRSLSPADKCSFKQAVMGLNALYDAPWRQTRETKDTETLERRAKLSILLTGSSLSAEKVVQDGEIEHAQK